MSKFKVCGMNLEVKKATIDNEEFKAIERIFKENWGDDPDGHIIYDSDGLAVAMFSSEGSLCKGEREKDAHLRIKYAITNEIEKCEVKTQWSRFEYIPYMEYVG